MATDELALSTMLWVFGAGGVGAGLGGALGGPSGALWGGFAGTVAAAVVVSLRRLAAQNRAFEHQTAVDVRGLAPQQALSVMSAVASTGHHSAPRFQSELLTQLAEIGEDLAADQALEQLDALHEQHPRSPAVLYQRARLKMKVGEPTASTDASAALMLALDGGMNPMAAKVFAAFFEQRAELELPPQHWVRLAAVERARGRLEQAQWCEAAAEDSEARGTPADPGG